VRLAQRLGQLLDLGLQRRLPAGRPTRPAAGQALSTRLQELLLPLADGGLADLFRRAASAIDTSPASTDNTMRILSSAGNTGGRLI
jgi:hypothetical protein